MSKEILSKKEKWQTWCTKKGIAIPLGISLVFLCLFVCLFYQYQNKIIQQQNRILGNLYLQQEEMGRKLCNQLLQEDDKVYSETELQEAAMRAQERFGYDSDAIQRKMRQDSIRYYLGMFLIAGIFLTFNIWIFIINRQNAHKRYHHLQKQLHKYQKERKQWEILEEKMEKLQSQTQTFIENIAHQLKTPLTRISLSLELMDFESMERDSLETKRELCLEEIEKVKPFVEEILNLARIESNKVRLVSKPMDLVAVLQDAIGKTGCKENYDWQFYPELSEEIIYYGDEIWLTQAFFNLYENAVRYTREGGRIQTEIVQEENGISLEIHDQGGGIPKETMQAMFQRFYTGNNQDLTRTGIGLNLAKSVVERHQGTLGVHNEEEGVVFSVYLPIYTLKA